LGPLMGFARQNPGASEGQMINYLKLMDTQFSKGLELAKAVNPKQAEDSTLKFLALMKDLVIEGVRNPVLQAIERSQPQPSAFEQILLNPEMRVAAKEMGMFGGSNSATTHLDLQIEQMRGERQLQFKKLDLELRKDELKRQDDDRRTDNILAALAPLAQVFAGPMSEQMRSLGQKQGATYHPHNPAQTQLRPPKTAPPQNVVQLMCDCGYQGFLPLTTPPQDEVFCPKCKQGLTVNPPETPSKEEN